MNSVSVNYALVQQLRMSDRNTKLLSTPLVEPMEFRVVGPGIQEGEWSLSRGRKDDNDKQGQCEPLSPSESVGQISYQIAKKNWVQNWNVAGVFFLVFSKWLRLLHGFRISDASIHHELQLAAGITKLTGGSTVRHHYNGHGRLTRPW